DPRARAVGARRRGPGDVALRRGARHVPGDGHDLGHRARPAAAACLRASPLLSFDRESRRKDQTMATTMTRHTQTGETPAGTRSERRLAGRLRSMVAADAASFALRFPSGYTVQVGALASDFCLDIRNDRGLRAVTSLDELRVCEAYMAADIDIEGDIRKAIGLREHLRDQNIWVTTWRHLQPLLHGRTKSNREWVSAHYDMDNLPLHFLAREYHTYTPGVFEHDDEPLEGASGRT